MQMWTLSWPVMMSNLLHALVPVVDTIMVGRLGPDAIAAIGLGNVLRMFLFILVLSVAVGSLSLISQAKGARNPRRMSEVTKQSLISGFFIALILGLFGLIVARPLLDLMDSSNNSNLINAAYDYLVIIFLGAPFLLLNFVADRLMQGAGDTKTPLILTAFMVILNIGLNYVFIFGVGDLEGLGIKGAAVGTVLARALTFAVSFYLFHSGRNVVQIIKGSWKPNYELIKDLFTIGLPSGIQGIFRRGSNLLLVSVLTATELGGLGAAVLAIGWQIETLIAHIVVGANVAGTSIVGQELGKWQVSTAYSKGNFMIVFGFMLGLILVIPAIVLCDEIIYLFDPSVNPTILSGTRSFVYIVLASLPLASISIMISGTMRGSGDTKPAMMSTFWFRTVLTIFLAYVFVFVLNFNSISVWIAMILGRVLDVGYMIWKWIQRDWVHIAIEKTEVFRTHLRYLSEERLRLFLSDVRSMEMAKPDTVEIVNEEGVIYRRGSTDIFVKLDDGYEGEQVI